MGISASMRGPQTIFFSSLMANFTSLTAPFSLNAKKFLLMAGLSTNATNDTSLSDSIRSSMPNVKSGKLSMTINSTDGVSGKLVTDAEIPAYGYC